MNENVAVLFESIFNYLKDYDYAEKIISVLVTVVIFFIINRIALYVVGKFLNENRNDHDEEKRKRTLTIKKTMMTFIRVGLLIVEILTILSFFINVTALLTVAGVGTLAISMAAKGFVEDMINGFVIVFEGHFLVGDYVDIEGQYGVVESIGVRTTTVRQLNGSLFIIHNRLIDQMTNYSKGMIKAQVDIGVAYEENIEHVIHVLNEVCQEMYEKHRDVFNSCPNVLGVTRLDPSAINIQISIDEDASRKFKAETMLRLRIKEVFDEKGIEIPYNKYVVYPESAKETLKKEEE